MTHGYVYAIYAPENSRHVKLGLSANPKERLKQLQTGNPYRLTLIWTHPCPDMAKAERTFHQAFGEYRIPGGEWFDFAPIDDPQILSSYLTMLAMKFLASSDLPVEMAPRLENLEAYLGDPHRFLDAQRKSEEVLQTQFPMLDQLKDDPEALQEYIWCRVARAH